jgi:hypothetical protein
MKKNCNGCRALVRISNTGGMCKCGLGYQTKNGTKVLYGINVETIPCEECPKPKTVREYMHQLNTIK